MSYHNRSGRIYHTPYGTFLGKKLRKNHFAYDTRTSHLHFLYTKVGTTFFTCCAQHFSRVSAILHTAYCCALVCVCHWVILPHCGMRPLKSNMSFSTWHIFWHSNAISKHQAYILWHVYLLFELFFYWMTSQFTRRLLDLVHYITRHALYSRLHVRLHVRLIREWSFIIYISCVLNRTSTRDRNLQFGMKYLLTLHTMDAMQT
jgi:hypothetical protein